MISNSSAVERLIQHGFTIEFPNADEIERLHTIILDELSNNQFTEESRQFYVKVIQRLHDEQQVEGVVLGCTEIPQLVKQSDIPQIALFDSTQLHVTKENCLSFLFLSTILRQVQLAVDYQLGRCELESILPNQAKDKNGSTV